MHTMPISRFKATCLAALERVRRTGQPLRITRFGKVVADVVPAAPVPEERRQLGLMAPRGTIHGDLVSPLGARWEALE